jgi:hypothetical protein
MSSNRPSPHRYFTVEQANAMLPLVRAIVKDLAELSRDVIDRRDRLAQLLSGRNAQSADIYSEELTQVEQEIDKDSRRLRDYVEELLKLGVEPKNGPEGLVDFPALMDGKEVYLCWKLGEPEVLFWHDMDAGFAGRQSLTADAGVDSCGASGEGLSDGHDV